MGPVQADHGQGVTGAQVVEEISEACLFEGLAGDHVLEHPVRSGGLEATFLPREVLVTGRNAGIAEDGGKTPIRPTRAVVYSQRVAGLEPFNVDPYWLVLSDR
jgi:hypothetical protein